MKRSRSTLRLPLLGLLFAVLTACGGGGGGGSSNPPPPPAAALRLSYTDPATGSYRLVRNSSSTDKDLYLDLKGPAGTLGTGVAIALNTNTGMVAWDTTVANGKAFNLGATNPLLKGQLVGSEFQAVLVQKGMGAPVDLGSAVLATFHLSLGPGATAGPVTLAPVAARCQVLTKAGIKGMPLAVGSLEVK